MQKYNLVILGGGPAGYMAAERASSFGMSVALVEERKLGGTCLNEGCIPAKTLLNSVKILDSAKTAYQYGVKADNCNIDAKEVMQRKDRVVQVLVNSIKAKMKELNVSIFNDSGYIAGLSNGNFIIKTHNEELHAERILIATGSEPIIPAITGIEQAIQTGFVATSRELLGYIDTPPKLTILGGGVIGLEMAAYYNALGSKVTIVEMFDHIAGNIEPEIGQALMRRLSDKGIEFILSARVTAVHENKIIIEKEGKTLEEVTDKVLLSVGRKPRIEKLGLEHVGIETKNGKIATDKNMRTNIENIYAAGDVTGEYMLAHAAYREAEVAVNHMCNRNDTMRYRAVPSVIYTNPEVASVGETEKSARKNGYDIEVATISMNYSGRYIAEVEKRDGLCKIILDKRNDRIIGVHLYGSYASEIILSAAMMIETELRVEDIKELIFPHPTISEIIREAVNKF